jgi:hypothetical protein
MAKQHKPDDHDDIEEEDLELLGEKLLAIDGPLPKASANERIRTLTKRIPWLEKKIKEYKVRLAEEPDDADWQRAIDEAVQDLANAREQLATYKKLKQGRN